MKKNEIRFIATENGINCEGNVTLSQADKKKVNDMLEKVQNAAKDCGVSLSLSPVGIQLGFNVALSCDMDCIHEAAARMKCVIEQMREFISKLEPEKNDEDLKEDQDKLIAEHQHKLIGEMFDTMHEQYPNAKLAFICDNEDWTCVASNMHPMHALSCMMGALSAERHGKNQ